VREDADLEIAQPRAWSDTELVAEPSIRTPVGPQGVVWAAGAVVGDHQLRP
jgi:hypothetical protein